METKDNRQDLLRLAARYIWWKEPEEAAKTPNRVLAQVMDLGTLGEYLHLENQFGVGRLSEVLAHAEEGWFHPRSWNYWHYRLGLASRVSEVPAMPQRISSFL